MWKLAPVTLAVLAFLIVALLAWVTFTVSDFMRTSSQASWNLLSEIEVVCPARSAREMRPWSKAGWVVCCDLGGELHGPWLAAEEGRLAIRGEYYFGERQGVWEWYGDDGRVSRRVTYESRIGESKADK